MTWILLAVWAIGSLARGINQYTDSVDYNHNRQSAIFEGAVTCLFWPALEVWQVVIEWRDRR